MRIDDTNDKNIKEEGERMVPAFHRGALVYGEHITRYESVAELVKGKVVLDIASGSGYGSEVLARTAEHVTGVDIDSASVEYATRNYKRANIDYVVGSAEDIPLADDSVDVVVTFETIEHIPNYEKFLKEIKRVTKPGGFAIVSTPNDPEFPVGNHFHLHQFSKEELERLLKKHYKFVEFNYQFTWLYAAVMRGLGAEKYWERALETINCAPLSPEKALYFIAICSDHALPDPLKIKEIAAASEHYSARLEQEKQITRDEELAKCQKKLEVEREKFEVAQKELELIRGSLTWRISEKLRHFVRRG